MSKVEYKELGEILNYIQPTNYIVSTDMYVEQGIPVLTPGKTFLLGYTNDEDGVYSASVEKPIILFDDFTTSFKYVDFPFKAKSSACKILVSNNKMSKLMFKYIYYAMQNIKFDASQHKRFWISQYSKINIKISSVDKCEKIASTLDLLHERVELLEKEIVLLEELVESKFNQVIKKNNLSEITIGKVAEVIIGLTYSPSNICDDGIIVLRSGNVQNNKLYLEDDIVRVKNVKIQENKFIQSGDILMCSRNGSIRLIGKSCLIESVSEPLTFGAFMTVIRSKYPYFTQSFFVSDLFKNQLTNVGTSSVNQITSNMLREFSVPNVNEQIESEFSMFCKTLNNKKNQIHKQITLTKELINKKMDEYFGG